MSLIARIDAPRKAALVAALLTCLVWLAAVGLFPRALHTLQELSGDHLWRLTASSLGERRIILVDIDEASLAEIGPWPWTRPRLAELSDRLAAAGVALQVFDIVLSAPAAGDAQLAASLGRNNGVLAQVFSLDPHNTAASGHPAAALPWAACPASLPQSRAYLGNPLAYADLPVGHITPLLEHDGGVRRQPALICHEGKVYPALFIAALVKILDPKETRLQPGGGPLAPFWQLHGPALGARGLPLDAQGNVRIPWTLDPAAFISVSARDILAGRVPDGLFSNAWVVIGGTALGLNDRVATPFGENGAGFSVHAQLLRGALDDRLPVEPAAAPYLLGLAALGGVLLLGGLGRLRRAPVWLLPLVGLCIGILFWALQLLLLVAANLWLPWVKAALFVILFACLLSLVDHARNRLERERLYAHLASYLPGPVAALLSRRDPSGAIDAERITVTALHADIRNFSAYCEASPPEQTAAVLHAFFSIVTRCVEKHGGTVESFQGDAVLAVWGSHHVAGSDGAHAAAALAAALDILQETRPLLSDHLPDTPTHATLAPLAVGIGIETGLATVGSFGLARRRTHLALGRAVTTALRLQEMTVELAHPILIGEGSAAAIGVHRLESQGVFLLEGLKIPCHIYAYPLRECA